MILCKVSAVLHASWPIYKFCCCILLRLLRSLYSRMEWPGNLPVHKPVCLVTGQLLAVSWRWGRKIFPLAQMSHTLCDKQDNCWICLLSGKEQANLSMPCILTAVKRCIDHFTTPMLCIASKLKKAIFYKRQFTIFEEFYPSFLCVPIKKLSQSMDCCTGLREQASFSLPTQTCLQFHCTEVTFSKSENSSEFG